MHLNVKKDIFVYMKRFTKLISLFVVLLMVITAAITVNKTIFGHKIEKSEVAAKGTEEAKDTITVNGDGSVIIHTAAIPGTIAGYAGKVPLEIYISEGKISDVKALPNAETPSFFERASVLLDEWKGKTPEEAQALNVDAVSGATYSSAAIIDNMKKGLSYYDKVEDKNGLQIPIKIWIALAVTLAACIIPLFVKNRIYNNVQLVANVVVLGFWAGQFLDYSMILKYLSSGFTFPIGLIAIVMLIAAFIYPLFGKPQHYCNHICPLGSAQLLMAQVCGYKIKISSGILKFLNWIRKILWAVLMLLLWMDCLTGWMDLELFQAFQFKSASWGIIIAAVIFVALSTVISRPYCRFVCPTGSLMKRAENMD